MLKAATAVSLFVGATGFADKLIKNLEDQQAKPAGLAAAPGNARIESLEQIGKDIAQAAFIAGQGGPPEDKEQEWRQEVLKELREWRKDSRSAGDDFMRGLRDALGPAAGLERANDRMASFIQGVVDSATGGYFNRRPGG
jgi:hypothetical protein